MDKFIARENIKHFRQELEKGVEQPQRATMLRLLVEEENRIGLTGQQRAELDHYISRLSEIMARQVELIDNLRSLHQPTKLAELALATLNDLRATYMTHRQKISAQLAHRGTRLEDLKC